MFEITWETPEDPDQNDREGVDMDLRLYHPDWSENRTDLRCDYQNISSDWGEEGPGGNPSLIVDDVDGRGPEQIILDPEETFVFPYLVDIHLFKAYLRIGTPDLESRVTLRAFYLGDEILEIDKIMNQTGQKWNAIEFYWENETPRIQIVDIIEMELVP